MHTVIPLGAFAPGVAQLSNSLWSPPNPVVVSLKVRLKDRQCPEFVSEGSSPLSSPGLSTTSLIFHLSCWVDTLHKGCVPKAVVCKSGSSCFQGHRGGWAGQRHRWARGALPCFPGAARLVVSHTEFLPQLWGKVCCSERLQSLEVLCKERVSTQEYSMTDFFSSD